MSLLFDREKPKDVKDNSLDLKALDTKKPESPNGLIVINGI